MIREQIKIGDVPAIVWGKPSKKGFLFIHGQGGNKEEAQAFAQIAEECGYQVMSMDLPEHGDRKGQEPPLDPWHAVPELKKVMEYAKGRWDRISLRATSIGAWLSLLSFPNERLENCLFVSPVLDMERLISNMMQWAGVSEERLERERVIPTTFGQTLSWEYLTYVKAHPIQSWDFPTRILYGTADDLVERDVVESFTGKFGSDLTVMEGGEHWFHTPEQLKVLENWARAFFADTDGTPAEMA